MPICRRRSAISPIEGFKLIGGRVDFVDGARAAVTVYRHGGHVINVFAWANYDESLPDFATRNGYHIVFWRSGNLVFCAISDIALDDMLELSRLLKAATSPTDGNKPRALAGHRSRNPTGPA